jgi:hypothetical protein
MLAHRHPTDRMGLTLPQRLYLLGYDPDHDRFDPVSAPYRAQLLGAAALADLAVGGWLHPRGGAAVRAVAPPPEDPLLSRVLDLVSPHGTSPWITTLHRAAAAGAEAAVRDGLAVLGEVAVDRGRWLGVVPTRTVTPTRPERLGRLRERTRGAVLAGRDAADVPLEDAALITLAADGDVWTVLTAAERHRHRAALTPFLDRFDAEVPGLSLVVRTAVMATGRGSPR